MIPITSPMASSSAANYRVNGQRSPTGHGYPNPRSPYPPASAFFPLLSADTTSRLQPTPDAEAHFAYSTTLRRHQTEGASLASPADFAAVVNAEASSLWTRTVNTVMGRQTNEYQPVDARDTPLVAPREETKTTASGKFAHLTLEASSIYIFSSFVQPVTLVEKATINFFRTSGVNGLLHSDIDTLHEHHGYNEFSVASPEPLLLKFAKTIYESPLILLLCGSATISALMGNVDDAISITVAVLIVLTGMRYRDNSNKIERANTKIQLASSKSDDPKKVWRR